MNGQNQSQEYDPLAVYCRLITLALAGGAIYGAASAIRKVKRFYDKLTEVIKESPHSHLGEVGAPWGAYEYRPTANLTKESFHRNDLFVWEKGLYDLLNDKTHLLILSVPVSLWSIYLIGKATHRAVEQVYSSRLKAQEKKKQEQLLEEYKQLLSELSMQKEASDWDSIKNTLSGVLDTLVEAPIGLALAFGFLSFAALTPMFANAYKKSLDINSERIARKRYILQQLPSPIGIQLSISDFKSKDK